MTYKKYIKDHWIVIALWLGALILIEIFGVLTNIRLFYRVTCGVSFGLAGILSLSIEYGRKQTFYKNLKSRTRELDHAYLLPEVLEEPEFLEGREILEAMKDMERSMAERISSYDRNHKEYKEYIELWVHEIKLPIATGKLLVENNREFYDESMLEELDKIDAYAEQALFYARSNYVEKDYVLKKLSLHSLVIQLIKKNRKALLEGGISVEAHDLEETIYSDGKWLEFILQQILSNSIKYMGEENKKIEFWAVKQQEQVKLYIKDTGIGISREDLPRIYEKGFTGKNGRTGKKSTGIGLYLCKKLCEKMGHRIEVVSEEGRGCLVILRFPVGSMTGELFDSQNRDNPESLQN